MKRPFLLRMLPDRLRISVWGRFFRGRHQEWEGLYRDSELRHAPGVRMDLVPGDVISDGIAFTGIHELATTRRVAELAKVGGTFVDVGANLGYFSLIWAAARPDNRCFAFEASPRNVELLNRNIKRNNLASRIAVIPHAVGKSPGKMRFEPGPVGQTGWGGFAAPGSDGGIEVDVVRIDDVVPANRRIALLKIDIEGAETWALMGSQRLLASGSIGEIRFEQNKPRSRNLGIAEDSASSYLQSVGYDVRSLGNPAGELVEWSACPSPPTRDSL